MTTSDRAVDAVTVEACVDSVDSAVAAQEGGADRIELCAALLEGGLTPSAGALAAARARLTIGIHAMVRPRGGDFLYSDVELDIMERDIDAARQAGADGVVLGLLNPDGTVDASRTRRLIARARPLAVTFHRAFDMTRDAAAALEVLIDLGVERVLTSGQEVSAWDGVERLRDLVTASAGRIIVMPGGGVHEGNIERIIATTGCREIHVTGTRRVESAMAFRNPRCVMGGALHPEEYATTVTDPARVRDLAGRARRATGPRS